MTEGKEKKVTGDYGRNYFCSCGDVASTYHDGAWWCGDCAYELSTGTVPNYTVHQFGKFMSGLTPRQLEILEREDFEDETQ